MAESSTTEPGKPPRNSRQQAVEEEFAGRYSELRQIANRHLTSNKLGNHVSPTELVHDAYLKFIDRHNVSWTSRTHFLALGSRIMRQVLVDSARRNLAAKRGSGITPVTIKDELLTRSNDRHVLAVEDALRKLEEVNPQHSRIVEMRFFGGMKVGEVATELGISRRRVEAEWTIIRAWLRAELNES